MNGKFCICSFLCLCAVTFGFLGCGKEDPVNPIDESEFGTFTEVVNSGGEWVNESVNTTSEVVDETIDESAEDGSVWVCQTRTVNLEQNPNEFLLYQSGENIYPGAILQGGLLDQNPPPLVYIDRGPGRVMINLFTGEGSPGAIYQDITEVVQSEVTTAIDAIIAERGDEFPRQFSLQVTEVASQEHLALSMGLKYQNYLDAGFETEFSFNSDSEYRHWVVKLVQPFYEIIFEGPGAIDEWWAPGVEPDDLAPYVGAGNPPVYISSVRYGRTVYIYFESNASSYEIGADIAASFNAGLGGTVDANISADYASAAQSSSIKAVVYGGDTAISALALQGDDLQGVMDALDDGQKIKLAVPISYTLRDLKRRQVVRVKEATTYDITECEAVDGGLQDPLFIWDTENISPQTKMRRLGHTMGGARTSDGYYQYGGTAYEADVVMNWNDLSENGINLTVEVENINLAPIFIDNVIGVAGPVVEFYNFNTNMEYSVREEYSKSEMIYPAVDLENTDYTLIMIMGFAERSEIYLNTQEERTVSYTAACPIVMYSDMLSSWGEPGRNLCVGWSAGKSNGEDTQFRFRHEALDGEDCAMQLQGDLYRVYTIRFSQEDGMDLFIDGELEGHRPNATMPLDRYINPRLGAYIKDWEGYQYEPFAAHVRIRRVEAYQRALSDAQIEGRTISMRRDYMR